jgi:hypothetical protein
MWAYPILKGEHLNSTPSRPLVTVDCPQDVKTLKMTPNPAPPAPESATSTERSPFVCPLSMKEMNGVQPFVYLLTCGCVFTQAGLKTVSGAQSKEKSENEDRAENELEVCPQCAVKFSPAGDVITINPSQEEEEVMRAKMEHRRLLEPPKKSKKRKNAGSPEDPDLPTKKQAVPSLNPSIAAASRAVVSGLALEEAKRKAGMSDAVKSLYGSADGKKRKETFMTMGTFTRVRFSIFPE